MRADEIREVFESVHAEPPAPFSEALLDHLRTEYLRADADTSSEAGRPTLEADEQGMSPYAPTPEQRARRRQWLLVAAAVVVLAVAAGALVQVRSDDDVVDPASPSPTPPTETTVLSADPRTAFPHGSASTVPGVLLDPQPNLPVFLYEDRRVIWPDFRPDLEGGGTAAQYAGRWQDWFERRLTPEGLELVRAEIRRFGRLDPELEPPDSPIFNAYWDGEREIATEFVIPDLTWIPDHAWEDPEPRVFVPSRYLVCLIGASTDRSARLAQLPDTAAEWFVGARQSVPQAPYEGVCFDLPTDDAREASIAVYAAGAVQMGSPYGYAITPPGVPPLEPSLFPPDTLYIAFSPYLPHGNAVTSYVG